MDTMALFQRRFLQAAFAAAALAAFPAQSAPPLVISPDPLGSSTTSINPNIMLILDDSGSMASDYLPDYVNDGNGTGTTAACADAGDDGSGITDTPDACVMGDPPYNSPDFNGVYYNPNIVYRPGANADGTDMTSMTAANTLNWTKVQTDPYLSFATTNLATGYLDRVWCTDPADAATSGNCRQNSAYVFPNFVFQYGRTSGGAVKTVGGAPYYYRMQTAQFCAPPALTNCASGSSINPAVHTQLAPEFCTDKELKNCAAGANVTAAHVFSGVRWCSDQTTLATCQRKKLSPFLYAKHLGRVQTINCSTTPALCAAVQNEGNIAVGTINANGGSITAITIGGVSVISGPITVAPGATASTVAGQITNAISSFVSSPDFTAGQSGSNVNVTQVVAGAAGNGAAIAVTSSQVGSVAAIGRITVNLAPSTDNASQTISTVTVQGINLLCPTASAIIIGNGVTVNTNGSITAAGGTNSGPEQASFQQALVSRINTCAQPISPPGYTVTASINGNDVRLAAPVSMGATPNNHVVARSGSGGSTNGINNFVAGPTMSSVQAGVSVNAINTTPTAMSGGRDATTGSISRRIGVGSFSRTDIVPSNNSYTKGSNRTDCAGVTCTYDEEMTNFSNWYAYYRTRILMAKTSVGRAFVPIGDTYRVGFITICPVSGTCGTSSTSGLNVVPAKYLKIATFDSTQKPAWYAKMYSISPGGNTPLREALSRVGRMFAGSFGSGLTTGLSAANDETMTASCQPNFAILATDGYWNGTGGQKVDGTAMDNQDNNLNDKPWTSRETGTYDGPPGPGPTNTVAPGTLADVAMYYYKNDLRTSGPFATNNVPTTTKDKASHQHMVTFTIGLGLDGQLTYRADYEDAPNGDFFDIKQGVGAWPVPVGDTPSALDDLWHAAVNGRGVFFSARNPEELSQGLTDTLNQLLARKGAGAAAATSNLQPVSGDNFAFLASYQTQTWNGDLVARTIDLSTLHISNVDLWSAARQLDSNPYTNRMIYTYDPADVGGNRLKSFCWPGTAGAVCADGGGLNTAQENIWFNPAQLNNGWNGPQTLAATRQSLVNYLRGDTTNENTNQSLDSDLYRARVSRLGDLVNAQPAYARKATFNYSDPGYAGFKACTAGTGTGCAAAQFPSSSFPRRGTVYAAGNDGMLHAFETDVNNNPYFQTAGIGTTSLTDDTFTGNNTGNGVERWAYVPRIVMPELFRLADFGYTHKYYADGSPRIFDICISTPCAGQDDWRTILLAGVNAGGNGYYALDITNPLAPKALWEFSNKDFSANPVANAPCYTDIEISVQDKTMDCHVGLSYAYPIATKRTSDGKWVVLVTSGYNNAGTGGDGRGYLYILDAVTGKILNRITTGSGTAASPSGLGRIAAWADDASTNNLTLAAYGGDLDGNLWRFQLDSSKPGYLTATKVGQAKDSANNPQPITVMPELTTISFKRVIMFGTGKFLEQPDRSPPFKTQTIYALADDITVTGAGPVIPDVRNPSDVVVRFLTPGPGTDQRTVVPVTSPTDWATQHGWLVDLPDSGERVNIDPLIQLGFLSIPSNVPTADTCTAGGYSWFNFFDLATGGVVPAPGNLMASQKVPDALLVGQSVVCAAGGNCEIIAVDNTGKPREEPPPIPPAGYTGRRVSWRELIVDQ
jgi:type IV pilus assembly protein PilY1